jgi:hypothetical protein
MIAMGGGGDGSPPTPGDSQGASGSDGGVESEGSKGGLGDEYGRMVGGVPPGVRFQIASDDMLGGEYVDFLWDLPERARMLR